MQKNSIISDMEKRGVEWIFIGSVDNVLLKNIDTLLIGLTANKNYLIGTKTVLKNSPDEKVGVFSKQNNQIRVIEYTEIPEDIANLTYDDGELVFGESHIMCNLFNIDALEKLTDEKNMNALTFVIGLSEST